MKSKPTLLALALLSSCGGLNPRVVEPAQYLAGRSSTASIYDDTVASSFAAPFDVAFEPIGKILLVNFEDPTYEG